MIVVHVDTGRDWRGGQAQVLLLATGLAAHGVHCRLLAPPGPLLERAASAGIEAVRWNSAGEFDPLATVRAAGSMRGADVVHCHSAHAHALGVPAARLAGVPAIVVSRRVDFDVAQNPFSRWKYRLPVDRYLCISRGVIEVMRRAGIPEARLALVPSGIPQRAPTGAAPDLRSELKLDPACELVGTVAALAPHKNHADLLRAAAILVRERPLTHFVWVGEGECRPALERLRREFGLESRVHLLGFRPDASALLPQFTLFVLPSYLEGLCTSLLDAQLAGVAIVATAVGGVPDVVTDGVSGRLVTARDPSALAAAMREALDWPDLRERWAAAGRMAVASFSAEAMVERTLAQYRLILESKSGPNARA